MSYVVAGRWCWTADKRRLVRDGHPDAAFLAYPSGTEIPDSEAISTGLVSLEAPAPVVKASPKPADKSMPAPQNKARRRAETAKDVASDGDRERQGAGLVEGEGAGGQGGS